MNLYRYASPATFYPLAGKLAPIFFVVAALSAAAGLYLGLWVAPVDYQQGQVYRIIFMHVPTVMMGMFIYLLMAFYGVLSLTFKTRLSAMMMSALAPTGALFTALGLWSGAFWGRPTWGTYWVWDARMTSTLILLFLYGGYLALVNAIEDTSRADRAGALLVVVGSVNLPIIYFSVKWWNTLHQGYSISPEGSRMAPDMLKAFLLMMLACWSYTVAMTMVRVRGVILDRERDTAWAAEFFSRRHKGEAA